MTTPRTATRSDGAGRPPARARGLIQAACALASLAACLSLTSCRSERPAPAGSGDGARPVVDGEGAGGDDTGAAPARPGLPDGAGRPGVAEEGPSPAGHLPEAAPDDAPLPAPDEIPDFLATGAPGLPSRSTAPVDGTTGLLAAPSLDVSVPLRDDDPALVVPDAGAPAREVSLDALMKHVRLEDGDADDGSFASVTSSDAGEGSFATVTSSDAEGAGSPGGKALAPVTPPIAWAAAHGGEEPSDADLDAAWDIDVEEDDAPHALDACAHLEDEIDARMAYLRRVAAERDTFAWVESDEDATALRLLAAMRRCAEFPDDEDCRPPAMEVRLQDVEPPRHQYERWPTDLEAEHKDPDEVPNDPGIRELHHQLDLCRRRQSPQPLLDRGGRH
ncbi:MAG TPA: hypothetical protein VGD74_03640 [Vulgatibacter sp.]